MTRPVAARGRVHVLHDVRLATRTRIMCHLPHFHTPIQIPRENSMTKVEAYGTKWTAGTGDTRDGINPWFASGLFE